MANHHLIEKHIFNIEVNTSKNVYAIQQKVSEMVWKDLVTELSKLFDSMVSENEVMRFDTLELDLGNISFNEADTEKIVEKIIVLLKEEIIKKKQYLQSASNVGESVWNINSQKTKSEHYFEIWLYWLRKGMLPSYTVPPQNNWMELVLEVLALNSNAVLALENTIKKHSIALERLILQHDPKDLKSITELYTGFSQSGLLVFFKELESIYKTITITLKVVKQ